jgi:mono/diheme cytochrome c family protein
MRVELKGLIAAVAAMIVVLGGAFGISAIVTSREEGQSAASGKAASSQMTRDMGRLSGKVVRMDAQMSSIASAQIIATGHNSFTQACSSCHGAKGQGGYGPSLYNSDLPDATIALIIKNGVKGKMPAVGSQYKDSQIQSLTAYIRSLKK